MQTVREFDEQDSDILSHRDQHFSDSLCRGGIPIFHFIEFGDPVDQSGNILAKVTPTLFQRIVGVLYGVVQQPRRNRCFRHAQFGQDSRDRDRMRNVGLSRLAELSPVVTFGGHISPLQKVKVSFGMVFLDCPQHGFELAV